MAGASRDSMSRRGSIYTSWPSRRIAIEVFSNRRMSLKERVWRVAEEAPFRIRFWEKYSSRRGGGNVGSAFFALSKDEGKSPVLSFGDFPSSVISTDRSPAAATARRVGAWPV